MRDHTYNRQAKQTHKTKALLDLQLTKMFELMVQGFTDLELMKTLQITERTFYRYKKKLYKKYGDLQRSKTEETIMLQQEVLFERLLSLFKQVELKIVQDRQIMRGDDLAALTETARNLAVDLLKLETEGFRSTNIKLTQIATQDEIHHIIRRAEEKAKQGHGRQDDDDPDLEEAPEQE